MTIKEILKDQEYFIEHKRDTSDTYRKFSFYKKKIKHNYEIYRLYLLKKSVSPTYPLIEVVQHTKSDFSPIEHQIIIDNIQQDLPCELSCSFFNEIKTMYKVQEEQKAERAKAELEARKEPFYRHLQDTVDKLVR